MLLSSEAFLPGYLVYLLMVFIPGIGLGELLDIWPRDSMLMERLAYSFGLGLAVDTLVLLVRTSGLSLAGFILKGLDLVSVYSLIAIGIVALVLSVIIRKRLKFVVRPRKVDWILMFFVGALAIMELIYFQKYPIFPQYESADFGNHVQSVQAMIAGSETSIPAGLLYFGIIFQLASAFLLVGGEPLVTIERTMALLVCISPLLFYLVGKSLFSRRLAGLVVAAVYVFSGTIWFAGVFNIGLFPNFFGILASLFLIVVVLDVGSLPKSLRMWVLFFLALIMFYFSHYSSLTLLPALLTLPLVQLLRERKLSMDYLLPSFALIAPGILGLIVSPSLLSQVLGLAVAGGGNPSGGTPLSAALAGLPVLSFMALEVFDDVGFVFMLVFALFSVYKGMTGRRIFIAVPVVWLVLLVIVAPASVSAWRFSYEGIIPLTILAGYGIYHFLPKPGAGSRRRKAGSYLPTTVVLVLLLTTVIATSWGQTFIIGALTDTAPSADAQQSVYKTIYWLQANTSSNSVYLSATDWRFTFTNLMISRTTLEPPSGECLTDPKTTQKLALENNATYIIVTLLVTCSLPPNPQLFLWNTLHPTSNLTLVYSNDDVKVFKII
jgi:hypothetical protein